MNQPEDKGIILKDILEPVYDDKYYLSDKMLNGSGLNQMVVHNLYGGFNLVEPLKKNPLVLEPLAAVGIFLACLTAILLILICVVIFIRL